MSLLNIFVRILFIFCVSSTGWFGGHWFATKQFGKGFLMLLSLVMSAIIPFWYGIHCLIWLWSFVGIQIGLRELLIKSWNWDINR